MFDVPKLIRKERGHWRIIYSWKMENGGTDRNGFGFQDEANMRDPDK